MTSNKWSNCIFAWNVTTQIHICYDLIANDDSPGRNVTKWGVTFIIRGLFWHHQSNPQGGVTLIMTLQCKISIFLGVQALIWIIYKWKSFCQHKIFWTTSCNATGRVLWYETLPKPIKVTPIYGMYCMCRIIYCTAWS